MSNNPSSEDKRYYPRRRIAERLSPEYGWHWRLVSEEEYPDGTTSISGPRLRHAYRVRDDQRNREELVGRGELTRYYGLTLPR